MLWQAIGVAFALVLVVAFLAAAHYLNQIRDILAGMAETQRKLAARLGVSVR